MSNVQKGDRIKVKINGKVVTATVLNLWPSWNGQMNYAVKVGNRRGVHNLNASNCEFITSHF